MRILRNGVALLLAAALALAVAACGKQPDDTLKARFTALSETDLIEQILADPAGHQDEIASFGLDDFMTKFGEADAYRSYMVQIDVQNQNNFDVEVLNLQSREPATCILPHLPSPCRSVCPQNIRAARRSTIP